MGPYGVSSIRNGLLTGYSAHADTTSIIILNIMMNDRRNGTEHQCVTMSSNMMIQEYSYTIFLLYVAGEYQGIRKRIMYVHAIVMLLEAVSCVFMYAPTSKDMYDICQDNTDSLV